VTWDWYCATARLCGQCWYTAVSEDSRTWERDSVFDEKDVDKLFNRDVIPENQDLKFVSALGFIYERHEERHWLLYT
jgi:hypothetical protein